MQLFPFQVVTLALSTCSLLRGACDDIHVDSCLDTTIGSVLSSDNWARLMWEGPMFSRDTVRAPTEAPFGSKDAFISMDMTLTKVAGSRPSMVNVSLFFVDDANMHLVGYPEPGVELSFRRGENFDICCDNPKHENGLCGTSKPGSVIVRQESGVEPLQVVEETFSTASDEPLEVSSRYVVRKKGRQIMGVALCSPGGVLALPTVRAEMQYSFRNPYGYVPGTWYGVLPFYLTLMVFYWLLGIVLAGTYVFRREHLLPLHFVLLGMTAMSAVDSTMSFISYEVGNSSGNPPCCPVRVEYALATILREIKGALALGLLLAVCLGFGIVHRVLPRMTRNVIFVLVGLNALFGILDRWQQAQNMEDASGGLQVLSFLFHVVFFMYITVSLNNTKSSLAAANQTAKLAMYVQLTRILVSVLVLLFIMTLLVAGAAVGVLSLPWTILWLSSTTMDFLYFGIILGVTVIWWPSARTSQYSICTEQCAWKLLVVSIIREGRKKNGYGRGAAEDGNEQLGDTAVFSDDDSDGHDAGPAVDTGGQIEMTTPSRSEGRTKPTQPPNGDHFVIEDSEDEDDEHGMIDTTEDHDADPNQWAAMAPQEGTNGDPGAEKVSPRGNESPVV